MSVAGSPLVVRSAAALRAALSVARYERRSIGFVPTMGALHAGHLSLVEQARLRHGCTVVSLFVNPTQFGPHEDFQAYPRPFEADLRLLQGAGVDVVFAPEAHEVYPAGSSAMIDIGPIAEPLEGRHRPGHFRGVATVVLKLFALVMPQAAYFGRKDYQQTLVIRQLVQDFLLPIELCICPTIREADGLALSSRNVYLSPTERQQALTLSRSLRRAEELIGQGERNAATVLSAMLAVFQSEPAVQIDYVALADGRTLANAERIDRGTVGLIAARVGRTRLIDNAPVGEKLP